MKIKDLFIITQGKNLELSNLEIASDGDEYVNFVSRTSNNNGVVAKVKKIDGISPMEAGNITCAVGGSVLSTFVQNKPYYHGFHLFTLIPKKKMEMVEKLYYSHIINENKYKYSYGRQANKTLAEIELPEEIPEWLNSFDLNKYDLMIQTKNEQSSTPLNIITWKEFKIKDIFELKNCKCSNASDLIDGNDIPYIGAKKNENGIMKYVKYDENLVSKGNCIIFICDGQGSVGYSNYNEYDFIGSTTLTTGYNKKLNRYNGLFLVTILDKERPKYSFGRKYKKSLPNTIINLPITSLGEIDWDFMENYIKKLPYADKI